MHCYGRCNCTSLHLPTAGKFEKILVVTIAAVKVRRAVVRSTDERGYRLNAEGICLSLALGSRDIIPRNVEARIEERRDADTTPGILDRYTVRTAGHVEVDKDVVRYIL